MKQTFQVMRMTTHLLHVIVLIEDVINLLENDSIKLFKWFVDSQMKANKDKCHILFSGSENITIKVGDNIIGKGIGEKLLGINLDYKIKFNEH